MSQQQTFRLCRNWYYNIVAVHNIMTEDNVITFFFIIIATLSAPVSFLNDYACLTVAVIFSLMTFTGASTYTHKIITVLPTTNSSSNEAQKEGVMCSSHRCTPIATECERLRVTTVYVWDNVTTLSTCTVCANCFISLQTPVCLGCKKETNKCCAFLEQRGPIHW